MRSLAKADDALRSINRGAGRLAFAWKLSGPLDTMTAKHQQVAETLQQRIIRGDYIIGGLPAERRLADEIGVSRLTLRRALQTLFDRGLLQRQANGRLVVADRTEAARPWQLQAAIMVPTYQSADITRWQEALSNVLDRYDVLLRPIYYSHWDDPQILEVLEHFEAVFLVPRSEPIGSSILERLKAYRQHIIVLNWDMSSHGLRSLRLFPPSAVRLLLDRLANLGHQRIDCLNSQSRKSTHLDPDIQQRINAWRDWCSQRGVEGELINYAMAKPVASAYAAVDQALRENTLQATAIMCTTGPAAIGAMRAIMDHGLTVGKDLSVCAVNGERMAQYLNPRLCAIDVQIIESTLDRCIKTLIERGSTLNEPFLLDAGEIHLLEGESVGPPKQ
jgi:DNA-binding LacI/PurR family transcriptional regulator